MLYTSGMTLAGALAATVPALSAPVAGTDEVFLLSDRLPSAALFVSLAPPCFDVTAPIDQALRAAYRQSSQLVTLL
jgi:hypothetical protein